MRRLGPLLFRILSQVVLVSFLNLLFPFPAMPESLARMAPPWNPPSPPKTDACVPPAMLEAAWRDAVRLAGKLDRTSPGGQDLARLLRRARADGSLPFADTTGCPQVVFDPLTVMAIAGIAALTITLVLWAIAVMGST